MRLIDGDALIERIECETRHYVVQDEFDKGRIAGWNNIIKAVRDYIPTVDAVPVDKAISAIQEMIESIDEDFPLLDFNSRYMMERGMRMSLIQIKKLITDGERKGGDE